MSSVQTLANTLVALCREWKFPEAQDTLFHDDAVNIEPDGRTASGKAAIIAKEKAFLGSIEEIHLLEISDPVVADNHFAIQLRVDVTIKGIGRRNRNEICVYEVRDNKIIREQFFY